MGTKWNGYVRAESPYSGSIFAVHLALADHADNITGECYPYQETLAREARVSLRSVERAIKRMCDDGYLEKFKRGHQHRYRLLVSNGGPDTVAGGPANLSGGPATVAGSNRTVIDLSVELKPSDPSGAGGGTMPVGSLNDDDEMPEYGQTPGRKKDRFEQVPRENTHRRAVYEFEREMVKANVGRGYLHGLLHRTIKNLNEDGYSYDEIVLMIKTFFAKYGQDVRAKRREVDPAQMFAAKVHQLKAQMGTTIDGMRSGQTSTDRGMEVSNDRMARMRRIAGESK